VPSAASPGTLPPDPVFGRPLAVDVERTVDAPMARVWAALRDYRSTRPGLLTERFGDYAVRQGGEGAGTLVACTLRVGRRPRPYLLEVEEPTPGRQLRERDRQSALVATWTLTPGGDGERTVVRLAIALRDANLSGRVRRARARRALRRVYGQLLERLDAQLAGEDAGR
jgi:uncharacterized protein YndB with AHSA1/START domain